MIDEGPPQRLKPCLSEYLSAQLKLRPFTTLLRTTESPLRKSFTGCTRYKARVYEYGSADEAHIRALLDRPSHCRRNHAQLLHQLRELLREQRLRPIGERFVGRGMHLDQ